MHSNERITGSEEPQDWNLVAPPELVNRLIHYIQTEQSVVWDELLSFEKAGKDLNEIAPRLVQAIKDVYPSTNSVQIPKLLLKLRIRAVDTLLSNRELANHD